MRERQADLKLNWILTALLICIFMTTLDQTIVSTAMPTIVEKLGNVSLYPWIFTVYMLASTAVLPIFGKLSDQYGRKVTYLVGLLLFLGGSLLCGTSHDMYSLIVFRGIQGIGAGAMTPITFTLIFALTTPEKGARYQALFMAVYGMSSVLGPVIGAVITHYLDWQWNFFLNLPLGMLAFLILSRTLREMKGSTANKRVDYAGALLFLLSTVALMLGLKLAGTDETWSSWPVLTLFGVALLTGLLFFYVETRVQEPILPLSIFRNKTITITNIVTFVQGVVMFGALAYLPLFIQGVTGGNVSDTGKLESPLMLAVLMGAGLGGFLMRSLTWRATMGLSVLLALLGTYFMTSVPVDVNKWLLVLYMVILGFGNGIMMPIAQTAVTTSADEDHQGVATSTVTFFRTIGGVFGGSIMAAIVTGRLTALLTKAGSTYTDPQVLLDASQKLPVSVHQSLRAALDSSIQSGFWFLVGMSAIALVITPLLGKARFDEERYKEMQQVQERQLRT